MSRKVRRYDSEVKKSPSALSSQIKLWQKWAIAVWEMKSKRILCCAVFKAPARACKALQKYSRNYQIKIRCTGFKTSNE